MLKRYCLASVMIFFSSLIRAEEIETKYNGMNYDQARLAAIKEGWVPRPNKNLDVYVAATVPAKYYLGAGYSELSTCYKNDCMFTYDKKGNILFINVIYNANEPAESKVENASTMNVSIEDAHRQTEYSLSFQGRFRPLPSNYSSVSQCQGAKSSPESFVRSSGVSEKQSEFGLLVMAMNSGNFTAGDYSLFQGYCYLTVQISINLGGGNSFDQELTGLVYP